MAESGNEVDEESSTFSQGTESDDELEIHDEVENFENSVILMQSWAVRQITKQMTSDESKQISAIYQKWVPVISKGVVFI